MEKLNVECQCQSKNLYVGTGRLLSLAEQKEKTKDWPIMIAIKNREVPSDTFGQLAYNFFK